MKIFGHRGAMARALENTIESIGIAIDAGADGVEIDIRLTADGEVVLLHDATLDRTGQGHGPVAEARFEDVNRVGVPSLSQVLEFIDGRCALNVEIKAPESWTRAREIARGEKKTDIWFSSFNMGLMETVVREGFP
ncbi:MAG: glycerophosphodiester phosphodiesterase, partial [Candidatus Hydrogenedentota bacterium]